MLNSFHSIGWMLFYISLFTMKSFIAFGIRTKISFLCGLTFMQNLCQKICGTNTS
jgi:hypothetical protein